MFGFGRERRTRTEAAALIQLAMQTEVRKRAIFWGEHGTLEQRGLSTTTHHALARELLSRVTGTSLGRSAGQRLPSLSAMGLAIEALYYGLDDLTSRPNDRQLVGNALGIALEIAKEQRAQLNHADYEMWCTVVQHYVRHPLVVEMTRPACESDARACA